MALGFKAFYQVIFQLKRPMDRILKPQLMQANISSVDITRHSLFNQEIFMVFDTRWRLQVHKLKVRYCYFANDSTTVIEKELSRNHTETMFKHFNIPITIDGKSITVPKNAIQHIKARDFTVPGDISSAAFIVAALITPGSDITIHNVGINPTRSGIIDIALKWVRTLNFKSNTRG